MARRGITMVELLVSLGVIAIIVAIALPSIQSARESARRMQCQHHLRQILLATQSRHAATGDLPSFYNGTSLEYPLHEWDLFHMHSWRVPLLRYLELAPLKDQIAWESLATSAENASVARSVVPIFLCPSGGDPSRRGRGLKHGSVNVPLQDATEKDLYEVVRSDYDAMAGVQVHPSPLPADANPRSVKYVRWGIWGWPAVDSNTISGYRLKRFLPGKFREVLDGLSNTIALVERAGKPTDLLHGRPHVTRENPNAEYPGQVGWSVSNTLFWSIHANGVGVNESNATGIYSFHVDGANIGIADGSVRFLSESTDFDTLARLYGRADGGLPQ
ncbi:MAG: prepilin-type N-terminal cleavage/methylation domain-containing protein [Pirellulaceae bacterium]|nr:MAG: prepilin-type N-terminal cleavage/methylation domain-containing protein [Pirellulaceae bacterium]